MSYSFNPSGVLDVNADLQQVTQKLEASLSDLQQSVQAFTAANEGASVAGYAQAQQQWNQGQVEMNESLAKGSLALENIHDAYIDADNKGAAAFA